MIHTQTFSSLRPWPRLLVFGAIHGNEPCGTVWIQDIIHRLISGDLSLVTWSVTFVPICNPFAYAKKIRQVNHNLNRIFIPNHHDDPEYRCADFLTWLCQTHDVLLDIHSAHTPWPANVFQDYIDSLHTDLARATGISTIIQWRPEVYQDTEAMDTCRFMHSLAKPSVLVECGQHDDPRAPACASRVIENIMIHTGLIQWEKKIWDWQWLTLRLTERVLKDRSGQFARIFDHCEPLIPWEVIVRYDDGEVVYAWEDEAIVFPKHCCSLGDEWWYRATIV